MDEHRVRHYRVQALAFVDEAHRIFGQHEQSAESRVVNLEKSYAALDQLNLRQDDLFRQALRCAEQGLYRAAHVMAWAAFMDFLEEALSRDFKTLKALRPAWKGDSMEVMREYISEHQFVEATQPLGICTKNQMKALLGLLNRRNECAHPSDYYPGVNETLGFIAEVLQRLDHVTKKQTVATRT